MSIRVTQNIIYSTQVNNMNSVLNKLYDSTIQSSSGLRINKPSDDPLGAGRVVQSKSTLAKIDQYQENISTATGWLAEADTILSGATGSVTTILTRLTELAEQGATGTYTAENRDEISKELRQLYEQLMTLANSEYAGQYIFSGQKTDTQAYAAALGVTVKDTGGDFTNMYFEAEGGADYTVMVRATSTGAAANASYEYSPDGGATWLDATVATDTPETNRMRIEAGGVSFTMDMYQRDANGNYTAAPVMVTEAADPEMTGTGTWFYVRPTAIYQGDDNDTQVVIPYASVNSAADVSASGYFSKDVTVKIDENDGTTLKYSYSTDNGLTWTKGTADAASPAKLAVIGGYLELANTPDAGEQYIIHPHRAEIPMAISETSDITVNLIGKEVFGGVYTDPATGKTNAVNNGGNIFEIVGNLIAAAETNDQDGMAAALPLLTNARSVVLVNAAIVGGRENRLEMTSAALTLREYSETDRLSSIEDVDLTELLTRVEQQKTAYSAALQTASIIMQQSLLNYL